jgi:predicted RNA-binding protein (virulence factor B family)
LLAKARKMILGDYNLLSAIRKTDHGFYLTNEKGEEVLLPNAYCPVNLNKGDEIKVFVYKDSEDRIVATTMEPKVVVNGFACLKVNNVNQVGAFFDWGLPKDLLCPFSEQRTKMQEGRTYIIYLYLDEKTDRLVASSKINKFLSHADGTLSEGDEVDILVSGRSELGYNCIINQKYAGLVFENETFQKMFLGLESRAFVKKIREDQKIDVSLQQFAHLHIESDAQKIVQLLKENSDFLPLTDKSDPHLIKEKLQMSKKSFKRALGSLYKNRLIRIETEGIYLTN